MILPTHIIAVGGIVENEEGKVLLVNNPRRGWEFPGGQVEVGENLIEALVREVKEESGIDVEVKHMIGAYSNIKTHPGYNGVKLIPTKLMMDFVCLAVGGEPVATDESLETKWFERDEAMQLMIHQNYKDRYQAYLDYSGSISYKSYETKPEYIVHMDRQI